MLDLGESVSGWVTAPIVAALGISFTEWSGLRWLITIDAATSVAVVAVAVPLGLLLATRLEASEK
jgi:hypothetical protein